MREAWLVELRRAVAWFGLAAALAWTTGAMGLVFSLAACAFAGWHLNHLRRLLSWVENDQRGPIPDAGGVWGRLIERLQRVARQSRRRKKRIGKEMARFRQATEASPDAAVILREGREIVWLNRAAGRLLGLRRQGDVGQPITNLLRTPSFVEYLERAQFDEPLELWSPVDDAVRLSLRIVPYGKNRRLMLGRDVTRMNRLEQVRKDFVANVSHELRSPLTVLLGYLETMADDEALPETWRQPAQRMHEQALRMRWLVEDLLRLSHLEVGPERAGEDRVDVARMVETIGADCGALSAGAHAFTVEADAGLGLLGEYGELYSAFSNLVVNAVRYTPPGGAIDIGWHQDEEGRATFVVTDSGVGIEEHHIPRLTERFYRIDRARSREVGGTGLGLAIVKHVLARYEAELHISSIVGEGATFACVFPAARSVRAVEPAPEPEVLEADNA